jgi:uncharacterized protein (TIGR03000 family)
MYRKFVLGLALVGSAVLAAPQQADGQFYGGVRMGGGRGGSGIYIGNSPGYGYGYGYGNRGGYYGGNPWNRGYYGSPWTGGYGYGNPYFRSYGANYGSWYGSYPRYSSYGYSYPQYSSYSGGSSYSPSYSTGQYDYQSFYPSGSAAPGMAQVWVNVRVHPEAELWFNGAKTTQMGPERQFVTPPLQPGKNYSYEVTAQWMENGQVVKRSQTLNFDGQAQNQLTVDFMNQATTGTDATSAPDPRGLGTNPGTPGTTGFRDNSGIRNNTGRDVAPGTNTPDRSPTPGTIIAPGTTTPDRTGTPGTNPIPDRTGTPGTPANPDRTNAPGTPGTPGTPNNTPGSPGGPGTPNNPGGDRP